MRNKVAISIPSIIKDVTLLDNGNGTRFPQYLAAILASFSAFSTGNVIGWTSQISPQLLDGHYGFPINQDQLGWIGSLTSAGAAILSLVIGAICDKIGRKLTKLLMIIPLAIGWGLITWATTVEMLYIGRFLTGMVGGSFLATAPLYCSEISQKEIRGSLGSLTQLMISFGLLFDVILGKFVSIKTYTLSCFCVPFLFAAGFIFMPETPVYYLKKNNEEGALRVLMRLRGENYDIESEMIEIKQGLKGEQHGNVLQIIKNGFKKRATRMGFLITVFLMVFRFLCGIDAITAYTSFIFKSVTESFDPQMGAIILISIQVLFGIIQSVIVDKVGRRVLLLSSQLAIAISVTAVGVCFVLKNQNLVDEATIAVINYIPLIALAIFSIGFAIGLAPIPLMLNAEMNPQETKSIVISFNNFLGWMLAFVVTKTFLLLEEGVGPEGAFFIYGGVSFAGVVFTLFFVPETKGKSSEEIQVMLEKR